MTPVVEPQTSVSPRCPAIAREGPGELGPAAEGPAAELLGELEHVEIAGVVCKRHSELHRQTRTPCFDASRGMRSEVLGFDHGFWPRRPIERQVNRESALLERTGQTMVRAPQGQIHLRS